MDGEKPTEDVAGIQGGRKSGGRLGVNGQVQAELTSMGGIIRRRVNWLVQVELSGPG